MLEHLLQLGLADVGVFFIDVLDGVVHLCHVLVIVLNLRQLPTEPTAQLVNKHTCVRTDVPLGPHHTHQCGGRSGRPLDDGVYRYFGLLDEVDGCKRRKHPSTVAVDVQVDWLRLDVHRRVLLFGFFVLVIQLANALLQPIHRILRHTRKEVDMVASRKAPRRHVRVGQTRMPLWLGVALGHARHLTLRLLFFLFIVFRTAPAFVGAVVCRGVGELGVGVVVAVVVEHLSWRIVVYEYFFVYGLSL